jgi:hypothetical protein
MIALLYWYPTQLLQLDVGDLLTREKSRVRGLLQSAGAFIQKPFRIQLGRGSYGECLVCEQHALAFSTDSITCVCLPLIASWCITYTAQLFWYWSQNCITLALTGNSCIHECSCFSDTMLLASGDRHFCSNSNARASAIEPYVLIFNWRIPSSMLQEHSIRCSVQPLKGD